MHAEQTKPYSQIIEMLFMEKKLGLHHLSYFLGSFCSFENNSVI